MHKLLMLKIFILIIKKIPDHYNDQNRQFLKDYVGIETKERLV